MPLIDVTYDGKVGEEVLRRLGELLPDVVGGAVECPEEPSTGPVEPGDIEIRFRRKSPLDVGDLDVVIEVRTKLFEHRVRDKQRRADLIRDRLSSLPRAHGARARGQRSWRKNARRSPIRRSGTSMAGK